MLTDDHPPVYYAVRGVVRFIFKTALVAVFFVGVPGLASLWTQGAGL